MKSPQLDLPLPRSRSVWREERVIHLAVLLDCVALGNVVANCIEIQKGSSREHFGVVDTNPLLPDGLLLGGQSDVAEMGPGWISRPGEFRAHDAGRAHR